MTIQTIALKTLTAPAANPRRTIDTDALDGLAASIRADGLLQNLVVRKKGRKYEVVSGARRLSALNLLHERGDIDGDFAVPVEIRGKLSADDALRLATVENVQREQLDPIDEAEAFARMVTDGAEIADVATKAGVSDITVKRRLALAALCEEAKEAVRTGKLPLSVAEALTLGTADQQREVLDEIAQGAHYDAEEIRNWLTDQKPTVATAIFPVEQYTGSLTRDLFGADEATFFDDVAQFQTLQREAVEALAETHRDTAAWVEIMDGYHVPWWQYREAKEGEDSGVIIHLAPSGRVEIRTGLARHEVSETVKAETAEAEKPAKPRPEYSGPLVRYIAAHKTLAVQAALLADVRKAKEVAVVQMMGAADWCSSRVRLEPHYALSAFEDGAPDTYGMIEETAVALAVMLGISEEDRQTYARPFRGAWDRLTGTRNEPVALYEAVTALSDDDLDRLHLLLTTLCFGQGNIDALDSGDSLFNRVAQDLGIDMADHWRPDEAFLSRRTMSQLEDVARESGAIKTLGRMGDYKKKGLVAALVRIFTRTDDDGARTWLPGVMRFPAAITEPEEQDAEAA